MTSVPQPLQGRTRSARLLARLAVTGAIAASFLLPLPLPPTITAQVRSEPSIALSDAEFWEFFVTMSEPGGSFVSENFVSNEIAFQHVIPTLQRSLTHDGVYLGVGPEQNFTYIANLKPRLSVIFDIRRQNAMQHLMYKALFELSPTRADFIARLFSRPTVARLGATTQVAELFDSAMMAAPSDSAYHANRDAIVKTLIDKHGFALAPDDLSSIEYVYGVFYRAGANVNYGYRSTAPTSLRSSYSTYGMLQSATNADSVQMAFLATEDNYRAVRERHLRNLIVPVVGDFAGPTAIRSVGEYLRKQGMTVTAFYLSNVEQYLFREAGAADRFYGNVGALPIDSASMFIRSIPRVAGANTSFAAGTVVFAGGMTLGMVPNGRIISVAIRDSAGVRMIRIVRDSVGVPVMRIVRDSGQFVIRPADSTRAPAAARQDSLGVPSLRFLVARDSATWTLTPGPTGAAFQTRALMMGGVLNSGLANIHESLDAFFAGRLTTYQDVIAMTKTSGWR